MSARLLRLLLLTAALLLGQLGGLAHGIGHIQDKERPHTPCQLCVAYAAFDHAAAAAPNLLTVENVCPPPLAVAVVAFASPPSRHYHARAPPAPLV